MHSNLCTRKRRLKGLLDQLPFYQSYCHADKFSARVLFDPSLEDIPLLRSWALYRSLGSAHKLRGTGLRTLRVIVARDMGVHGNAPAMQDFVTFDPEQTSLPFLVAWLGWSGVQAPGAPEARSRRWWVQTVQRRLKDSRRERASAETQLLEARDSLAKLTALSALTRRVRDRLLQTLESIGDEITEPLLPADWTLFKAEVQRPVTVAAVGLMAGGRRQETSALVQAETLAAQAAAQAAGVSAQISAQASARASAQASARAFSRTPVPLAREETGPLAEEKDQTPLENTPPNPLAQKEKKTAPSAIEAKSTELRDAVAYLLLGAATQAVVTSTVFVNGDNIEPQAQVLESNTTPPQPLQTFDGKKMIPDAQQEQASFSGDAAKWTTNLLKSTAKDVPLYLSKEGTKRVIAQIEKHMDGQEEAVVWWEAARPLIKGSSAILAEIVLLALSKDHTGARAKGEELLGSKMPQLLLSGAFDKASENKVLSAGVASFLNALVVPKVFQKAKGKSEST